MDILRTILMVVFIIVCVIMTIAILMQEGKHGGLGALAGTADSYWGKNKGRSMEGVLVKVTRILVAIFLILAAVLCIARLA